MKPVNVLWATFVFLAALTSACSQTGRGSETIDIATTTSVVNSGLMDVLLPLFEKETGLTVRVQAAGSGRALAMLEDGAVDLVISHAPQAESRMLAAHPDWRIRRSLPTGSSWWARRAIPHMCVRRAMSLMPLCGWRSRDRPFSRGATAPARTSGKRNCGQRRRACRSPAAFLSAVPAWARRCDKRTRSRRTPCRMRRRSCSCETASPSSPC